MAGDWIKMRPALLTSPRVNGIARALEENPETASVLGAGFNGALRNVVTRTVMRHVTVSALLIIWGAANEHTEDGTFRNADLSDLDDMTAIPGFGAAMQSVGWAVFDQENSAVILPNFNEYNTSGKERSAGAKTPAQRQKEYRDRKKSQQSNVTRDVTGITKSDVTSNHREEKRREELKPPHIPPDGGSAVKEKGKKVTFATFLQACRDTQEAPISPYRPVWEYAEQVRLPREFVELAWREFKGYYRANPKGQRTKHVDWRRTFLDSVKATRAGLWRVGLDGAFVLTTRGEQARREMQSQEQQGAQEHVA